MNQKTKKVHFWKLGVLTSLCTLLFILLACSEERSSASIQDAQKQKEPYEREIFSVVQEMPDFEGGMDAFYSYVTSEIRYPKQAREKGIEGQVDVQFIVERDGSVTDVKAIKGIGAGCDDEAVRVIKNASSFIPGSQRGKKVRVKMVIPIQFKLNMGATNPDNTTQGNVIIGEVDPEIQQLQVDIKYDEDSGTLTGTVRSAEGDPLPGANIVVDDTNYGTVSDLDGTWKLKSDLSEDITISFVGYKSVHLSGKKD